MLEITRAPALITLSDHSAVIGTTSTQMLSANALSSGVQYLRIANPATNSGWIWYSRTGAAAVNTVGSYPLPPGAEEVWRGDFIPANAIWAIATTSNTLMILVYG